MFTYVTTFTAHFVIGLASLKQSRSILSLFIPQILIYVLPLNVEKGEGREKEMERNIDVREYAPQSGTEAVT